MSARKRQIVLFSLVLTHVLAAEAAVYLAYGFGWDDIRQMVPDGLLFASASMLGVWIAMGIATFRVRAACAAIGVLFISYLYVVLRAGPVIWSHRSSFKLNGERFGIYWSWFHSALLMASISAFVAGPLLLQRRFDLRLNDVGRPSPNAAPFQFSLRTLLLLALAFGPMCWMARASHRGSSSQEVRLILLLLDASLGFAAATGAILWAALGTRNPLRRCSVAMLAACANGLLLAYCLGRATPLMSRSFATLAASHALCVALSLLVVRWCGYRLHFMPEI